MQSPPISSAPDRMAAQLQRPETPMHCHPERAWGPVIATQSWGQRPDAGGEPKACPERVRSADESNGDLRLPLLPLTQHERRYQLPFQPCHPERSAFGAPITLGVIGVSGVEGPAFQEAAVRDNHVRFALIENEERTRQALRGIKAMLAKGVVPA